MNQMTKVAAVSLIALPIGFASLSTLWFTRKRKQQEQEHETQKSPTNLEKYLEFEKNITFYDTHGYRNIWKTYEGIFVILKSAKNLLSELLSQEDFNKFDLLLNKIYEKQLHRINYLNHLPKILILEGLQHCGMKTLQQNLMKSSSQIRLCPDLEEYLQILLIKLKQYPLSLLHAFQLFCDYYRYHLAEELSIKDSCYVLLNRFYHTTCVNQIISSFSKNINEIQLENIPSYAFQWPRDLPYPLLVMSLLLFIILTPPL